MTDERGTEPTESTVATEPAEPTGAEPTAAPEPERGSASSTAGATARRVAITGARLVTGAVGAAVAVIALVAVSVAPAASRAPSAPSVTVTPVPAAYARVCPGSLLQLGGDGSDSASTAASVGRPTVVTGATGAELGRTTVTPSASDAQALQASAASGALVAGAQSQSISTDDLRGLATAACSDPTSTSWLVGGATTTGRTSLIELTNPTRVDATVELRIWTESGPVDAPGLRGIVVKAGAQQVLSLAGFTQNATAPAIEVQSSGGRVTATLQESVVRAVDPGGVDLASSSSAGQSLVIPGVVISSSAATDALLGRQDYADLSPVLRVVSPERDTRVHVGITSSTGAPGAAYDVPVTAGHVIDVPLTTGAGDGDGDSTALGDGTYTVTVEADAPIAVGVRVAAALPLTGTDPLESPISDIAWLAPAPLIDRPVLVATPQPASVIQIENPSSTAVSLTLSGVDGAADLSVQVPAGASASVTPAAGAVYRVDPPVGIRMAVTTVGPGVVAGFPVPAAPSLASPLVVRP